MARANFKDVAEGKSSLSYFKIFSENIDFVCLDKNVHVKNQGMNFQKVEASAKLR
ncbi:hypothetical protein LACDD01_00833 [Lactococcus sp. DD01]|nr:hypothetical protein LACDD01_00833 [Lactococcus sp. DD01]